MRRHNIVRKKAYIYIKKSKNKQQYRREYVAIS